MKLLIHGCGYIGRVHLRSIRNYKLCDVALCDSDAERLRGVAEEFGVEETYPSLAEALEHPFDGVVICTPNFLHAQDVAQCARAGLSVMLEKPMSHTAESARKMVELCEEHGTFCFVAYCLRFAGTYRKIRELVRSGALGKVFGIRASVAGKKAITDAKTDYRTKKSMGGGVISDFSHEIDYSLWFAGEKVKKAMCYGIRAVHKEWDVQDTAEIILACENDVTVSVHMDFLQPYFGRSIEVYGTGGAIRWRDNEPLKLYNTEGGCWDEIDSAIDWDGVYRDEMVHYLDCLENGTEPEVGAREGLALMQVIEACVKDAENNA